MIDKIKLRLKRWADYARSWYSREAVPPTTGDLILWLLVFSVILQLLD